MGKYKVVILCGGMGTRLREETELRPKPMVEINEKPILWHIMKHYAYHGYNDFILCSGYKGEMIKEYFLNYKWKSNNFTLHMKTGELDRKNHKNDIEDWHITFVDTGKETPTGGRIKKIEKYINEDNFLATYGDGVSDVDIKKVVKFHQDNGKIATITGLHPWSKYGTVHIDSNSHVVRFVEKPVLKDLINGGFFVFKKDIFKYLDEDSLLEKEPFENLAKDGEIALYRHDGFWHCMDTYKDVLDLNKMCEGKDPPWKVWKE